MNIIKYPDPILLSPCERVTEFNGELKSLAENMTVLLPKVGGIAIAAPQIGIALRFFVMQPLKGKAFFMANPEIEERLGTERHQEGCLSLPGFWHHVRRHRSVSVKGQNLDGETFSVDGKGLEARALQHEIDHLNGVLFIDHLSKRNKTQIIRRVKQLQETDQWQ